MPALKVTKHLSLPQIILIVGGLSVVIYIVVVYFIANNRTSLFSHADPENPYVISGQSGTVMRPDGTILGPGAYQASSNSPIIVVSPGGYQDTYTNSTFVVKADGTYDVEYGYSQNSGYQNGMDDFNTNGIMQKGTIDDGLHKGVDRGRTAAPNELRQDTNYSSFVTDVQGLFSGIGHGLSTWGGEVENGINSNSGSNDYMGGPTNGGDTSSQDRGF